jgi:hypothetical protein
MSSILAGKWLKINNSYFESELYEYIVLIMNLKSGKMAMATCRLTILVVAKMKNNGNTEEIMTSNFSLQCFQWVILQEKLYHSKVGFSLTIVRDTDMR